MTTLARSMPLELPSATGLTTTGKRMPAGSRSRPVFITRNCGVSTPASATTRLARPLSSVRLSAVGSEPVYAMSSISSTAGTWASRLRPRMPSAMLKPTSMRAAGRRVSRSGVASSGTTLWPWDSSAARRESIVRWLSNSACASGSSPGAGARRRLWISPIRSGRSSVSGPAGASGSVAVKTRRRLE